MKEFKLIPFGDAKTDLSLNGSVRLQDGKIFIEYRIENSAQIIGMKKLNEGKIHGAQADELWKNTCFEAFWSFSEKPSDPYWEFNLAPDGRWNVYTFHEYRKRNPHWKPAFKPEVSITKDGEKTVLHVSFPFGNATPSLKLYFGLSAVIENKDGKLSYWALTHTESEPDFHDKRSFTLVLNP